MGSELGETLMISTWKRCFVGITAVVAVAIAGCSNDGKTSWFGATTSKSSGEDADSSERGADKGPQSEEKIQERLAATFAEMRTFDPCALLDRDIAQSVAGASPTEVVPGHELNECTLNTELDELTLSWGFKSTIGAVLNKRWQKAKKEKIGGENWLVLAGDDTCSYAKTLTDSVATRLDVLPPIGDAPTDKTACDIAKAYLEQTAPLFEEMTTREESATLQLPLAAADPCEAVPAVLKGLDKGAGVADPQEPYVCGIKPESDDPSAELSKADISIGYGFDDDPRLPEETPLSGPPGSPPVTVEESKITPVDIAGHTGVVFDGPGDVLCAAIMIVDEAVNMKAGTLLMLQTVTVYSADCSVAQTAAVDVLAVVDAL